jgi:uncharacterized sporulation protein YeaH/YhbH (DUF444 family)
MSSELAECDDAESRLSLEAKNSRRWRPGSRRIPYVDPIDIRYRRFENEPKPVAQAVMFCLMDVSGSMSEHMKDLAKRFYMLLYIFLTKQYRRVEIVFIRHTEKRRGSGRGYLLSYVQATGGTQVSSALEAMRSDRRSHRFDPHGELEHLCRPSLGRRQFLFGTKRPATEQSAETRDPAALPVFRLYRSR